MEKVSRWLLIGILSYIGVVLTSINNKMDQNDLYNTQYTVLNEVSPQSYRGENLNEPAAVASSSIGISPVYAALMIAGFIGVFLTWHISRVYHDQLWSKQILGKSYSQYREPLVEPRKAEPLHYDQEAVFDAPLLDGQIKDSWLPPKAQKIYAGWSGRYS
jgi:hypothetical protein